MLTYLALATLVLLVAAVAFVAGLLVGWREEKLEDRIGAMDTRQRLAAVSANEAALSRQTEEGRNQCTH